MVHVLIAGLPTLVATSIESRLPGVAVHSVSTGTEALDWLAGQQCQLLVVDQGLPGGDAVELVRRLTEQAGAASIPVVYCLERGETGLPERSRAERLGVRNFIYHPVDIQELSAAIAANVLWRLAEDGGPGNGAGNAPTQQADAAQPDGAAPGVAGATTGWERFRDASLHKLSDIDEAAVAMLEGTLDESRRQRAWETAHRLGNLLASFGQVEACRLARDIELLLERRRTQESPADPLHLSELVVALRQELERPAASNAPSEVGRTSPQLLLVTRRDDFAEGVAVEAEARGLRLIVVQDGAGLHAALAQELPAAVVLDHDDDRPASWLPLVGEATAYAATVPILVAAGSASLGDRVAVSRAGGFAFLRKPLTPHATIDAVVGAIGRADLTGRRVLAVDDDLEALAALRRTLQPMGIELFVLDDARRFWDTLEHVRPDVVLLDARLPHHSGLELCRVLRCDERWTRTPVLMLGDGAYAHDAHLAFVAGADDFVALPVIASELATRIVNRLERQRIAGELAGIDPLTRVATRQRCEQSLLPLVRLATRYRNPLSLAIVNVDGLSEINETHGYAAGDAVLRRVARLLSDSFRVEDVIGRLGGGQFVCGGYGFEKEDCVRRLMDIRTRLAADELTSGDAKIRISFTAGVATLFTDGPNLPSLWQAAEDALADATSLGVAGVLAAGWTPDRMAPPEAVDVVVIDPDVPVTGLLLHALENAGFHARWLPDGDGAVAALCGSSPRLRARVVLLEVDLPGIDGFAVLRALARDDVLARSRSIVVTARASEPEVLKAFELGAFDHVAKPFSVNVLLQRVRRALNG